jgi:hypothetical protein
MGFRLAMREHAEATFAVLPAADTFDNAVPDAQSGALDADSSLPAPVSGSGSTVFSSHSYFLKTPALVHGATDTSHVHVLTVCELIQCARDTDIAAAAICAGSASVLGFRPQSHLLAETHPALALLLPLTRLIKLPPGAEDGQAQVRQDGVSPLVLPRLGPEYSDASTMPPPGYLRAAFFCGLVECVQWMHTKAGVVHGDLVPANVMWRTADAAAAALEVVAGHQVPLLLRIVDLDAALPVGAPVPATAREITAENGFKRVYRESNI